MSSFAGDLAKAERSARAAHEAPLPLAGYPLFYVVSALVLQGEVDESEAALSFGVASIEGVSLMLLAQGDEVERIVRLEEATALLEGTRRRRVSPTPWSSSAVRCGARSQR